MRFSFLILITVFSFSLLAQSTSQNYPELMVVPKASERLFSEATKYNSTAWSNHLPLHVASATTMLGGILALGDLDKDEDSKGVYPKIAIAVGGGWLATSIWLQTAYRPYLRGAREVKKINIQNTRNQLAAERAAEEYIDQTARLAKKIKWLSFITNAGASALATNSAKKDTAGQATALLGTVTSLLPLLFPLSWEQVSEDQQSYKRKIFGPITFTNGLLLNPQNQRPTMGLVLATYFN